MKMETILQKTLLYTCAQRLRSILGTSKNSLLMLGERDFAEREERKPRHTLLYGKALLTVKNGGAKQAIPHKSCRKAEPLFGNKIAAQREIGIFRGTLLFFPAALFLAQSCELIEMQPLSVTDWKPGTSTLSPGTDWANLKIELSFSKAIDRESARAAFLLLRDEKEPLAGKFSFPDSSTLLFRPQIPLDASHSYTVEVSTKIEDIYGNSLEQPFRSRFSANADPSRPRILAYHPQSTVLNGQQAYEPIQLYFSAEMNRDSVYRNFLIEPDVEGLFSWRENILTFTPYSSYQWATEYTVSLKKEATNIWSKSMSRDFEFRFTFGDQTASPKLLRIEDEAAQRSLTPAGNPFDPLTDISDGWEVRDSLHFVFDKKVSRNSLSRAITISPYSAFELNLPGMNGSDVFSRTFTLSFNNKLKYDQLYSLSLSPTIQDENGNTSGLQELRGGTFYFRSNGVQSAPIKVLALSYLRDPGNTSDIIELSYAGTMRMDLSNYSGSALSKGFFDLHLSYASTATLENSDFYGKLRVSISGGATDLKVYRLEMNPSGPSPILITGTSAVLRIHLGIQRDPSSNDSYVTVHLNRDLEDSLGNHLVADWQFLSYLRQN